MILSEYPDSNILIEHNDLDELIYIDNDIKIITGLNFSNNIKLYIRVIFGEYPFLYDYPKVNRLRISLLSSEFINCEYPNRMTKREKDIFIKTITSNGMWNTVLERTIDAIEINYREYDDGLIKPIISKDLPMPDYTLLPTID